MSVIGFEAKDAEQILKANGFAVTMMEYSSKRGVPGADSSRVIRQRKIGDNSIQITVSRFKTSLNDSECFKESD